MIVLEFIGLAAALIAVVMIMNPRSID